MIQIIKGALAIIIGVMLFAFGSALFGGPHASGQPSQGAQINNGAQIQFVAKNNETAADALLAYAKANNITIDYKDYGGEMGLFIKAIGGVPSVNSTDKSSWWQFWVNGDYSNKGASSVMLNTGDTVEWKYTTAQEKHK